MTTPVFSIPEIIQGQSQKEITHNEALRIFDALVAGVSKDNALTAPPTALEGELYIVAAGASGEWLGHDSKIAIFVNSVWHFVTPPTDYILYNTSTGNQLKYSGTIWQTYAPILGGSNAFTYINVSAAANVNSWDAVVADSALGGFTLTLPPAPTVGDEILLIDGQNSWATNNVSVSGGGQNIEGSATPLVLNISGQNIRIAYINSIKGWAIIS